MAACIHHVYFKIVVVGEYTLFSVSSFSLSHPNSLWIHHSCVVHCHPPSWSSIAEALWTPLKTSTMTPLKAQSIIQWTMTSLNHSSPTCQESQICKQRVWICLVHIRSISLDLDLNSTTIVPWFGSQFNNEESHTLRIIGTHAHPH